MKKILFLSIFSIFLSCAIQPSENIPQTFNNESEEGMITGTISFENEKPIFNGYTFYYSGLNKTSRIQINPEQTIKMKFKPNFFDNEKAVYFFSISGIPGNYKFTSLHFFSNSGYMTSTRSAPINIDFKIEKGKVNYLGEIYVNYNRQQIQLNNKRERDLTKFKEMFPGLNIE